MHDHVNNVFRTKATLGNHNSFSRDKLILLSLALKIEFIDDLCAGGELFSPIALPSIVSYTCMNSK